MKRFPGDEWIMLYFPESYSRPAVTKQLRLYELYWDSVNKTKHFMSFGNIEIKKYTKNFYLHDRLQQQKCNPTLLDDIFQ